MHGFICIVSKEPIGSSYKPEWKAQFDFETKKIKRKLIGEYFHLEQFTSTRFFDEKIWINTDELLCVSEGTILNLAQLKQKYKATNTSELIDKMQQSNKYFFEEFEGSFCGVYHNKRSGEWIAFNNQTGTRQLFYLQNKEYFIVSTDLFTLSRTLKSLNISFSLNELAASLMLSSGFVMEDLSWIKEVAKLRAGEYIYFDGENLKSNFYFHLRNIIQTTDNRQETIRKLDKKFTEAVKLGFELNEKYKLQNFTTLSGGLDSRMTALTAYENGFHNQTLINFSEKAYADEVIAKQIATHYQLPMYQLELKAELLTKIDEVIAVNDGMGNYTGFSHVFSVLNQFDSETSGCIHTGIMGDTVMGSACNVDKAKIKRRLYASQFVPELAKTYIEKLLEDNYSGNAELAVIYNNIFAYESLGFQYFDLIGATCSPFLNSNFLSTAYAMPESYKTDRNIYVDWITTLHPEIVNFTWETIACKPTNNKWKRGAARMRRAILKRLPIPSMWKSGMNPEQLWYEQNETVKQHINSYFYKNVELIEDEKLRKLATKIFSEGSFDDKARVLTLVGAIKLHFA